MFKFIYCTVLFTPRNLSMSSPLKIFSQISSKKFVQNSRNAFKSGLKSHPQPIRSTQKCSTVFSRSLIFTLKRAMKILKTFASQLKKSWKFVQLTMLKKIQVRRRPLKKETKRIKKVRKRKKKSLSNFWKESKSMWQSTKKQLKNSHLLSWILPFSNLKNLPSFQTSMPLSPAII